MQTVLDLLSELGLSIVSLAGTLIQSTLLWLVVALAGCIGLFLLSRRLGWLDLGSGATRWSRVGFALVLFLLTGPAATAVGIVGSVRGAVCDIVVRSMGQLGTEGTSRLAKLVPAGELGPLKKVGLKTGGRSIVEAAGQGAERRLVKTLVPMIRRPFNRLMLGLGLVASLPPLLWLGGMGLARLGRRTGKDPPL